MAHTAGAINEGDTVFQNTGYAVALAVENDQYHDRAIRLVDQIEQKNIQLVTTRAVVTEIGDVLADPEYRGEKRQNTSQPFSAIRQQMSSRSQRIYSSVDFPSTESDRTRRGESQTESPSW